MDQFKKLSTGFIITMILTLSPLLNCEAMEGPDSVELDSLAQFYEPVNFDHVMHVEAAGNDCATCHHHTTGTPVTDANCARCHEKSGEADEVSCQGCHPANRFAAEYLEKLAADNKIYHIGKVGLKAAYHLRCIGCHEEVGAPTGCQECHPRNDAGDKMFHAGQYAPPPGKKKAGGHGGGHDSENGGKQH